MSSLRDQIDEIKSKIKLSEVISKHVKIIHKGKDVWCLCFFHSEKTPSMKINEDTSSYYCFGCQAKGDLISFYTDYLNYSFNDALKELANKAGVKINFTKINHNSSEREKFFKILENASNWYHNNLLLEENSNILQYLKGRNISFDTIKEFKIGYSYNSSETLNQYLRKKSFTEDEIINSNLAKLSHKDFLRDFFYKRLIFPIRDINSKIVGFGGRSLNNSEPKYINSPESAFFKKGKLLFNIDKAKSIVRKKENLLICEGYMDVISLYNKGIKSVAAPLGTALTYDQLLITWKLCKKPTLMFDGDIAGKKASIKSALLALKYLNPGYSIQFLELPTNEDPDSYINNLPKNEFIKFLKSPTDLSNYIFNYAKKSFNYDTPDQKIIFDKYFDDIINFIENKKVRLFYKKDFKEKLYLFFNNYKSKKIYTKNSNLNYKASFLRNKEIYSFIACFVNHQDIRLDIIEDLLRVDYNDKKINKCLQEISSKDNINLNPKDLEESLKDIHSKEILKKSLNTNIYKLFPYSEPTYKSKDALKDIKKSLKLIETRLSNFSELDKSLKDFKSDSTSLKWEDFKKLSNEILKVKDI